MSDGKRVSVCLTSYNGEKYISEQISSILTQLSNDDELIISDDGSADLTLKIISEYEKDDRVRVVKGPGKGVIANVDYALSCARGKYIFLSDQDDIWEPGKVEKVLGIFTSSNASCVIHDAALVDSENTKIIAPSFFEIKKCRGGFVRNIIKNSYIGCCMAFRRQMLERILPIPVDIKMHDQWIGLVCERRRGGFGKPIFLKDKLIRYRRHEGNQTDLTHDPLFKMIRFRSILIFRLIQRRI